MKKILLFLAFSIAILGTKAQIRLTDTQGNDLPEDNNLNSEQTFYFYIHNGSDSTIHFAVKAVEVTVVGDDAWEVCACGVCADITRPGQIGSITELAANSDYQDTHVTFFGTSKKDNSTLTLAIYNPYNPSDSVAVSFTGIEPTIISTSENSKIYPIITNDYITIAFDALSYQIYDINGKLITNGKLNGSKTISISELNNGSYIIHLKIQNGEYKTFKFIKK